MFETVRAGKQNNKQQKFSHSASSRSKVCCRESLQQPNMNFRGVEKLTRVEIPSKPIPIFFRDFGFPAFSHSFRGKVLTAKYHDCGKNRGKFFSIS